MNAIDPLATPAYDDDLPNPLCPLSIPFVIRATALSGFAIWMLLSGAKDMATRFSHGSATIFSVALFILSVAIWDGVRAFRTRVALPEYSVSMGRIYCSGDEVRDLMLSGRNPNERYLSWLGRWGMRISARFASLSVPYQRLTEVAITALAFAIVTFLVFVLLAAFGFAAGKADVFKAIVGWLWTGFVTMAYGFWVAMLLNFLTAARWARRLKVNRIIKVIAGGIILLAGASFTAQTTVSHMALAPEVRVQSIVLLVGSTIVIAVLLVLAWLRSGDVPKKITRSRITVSNTAAVHPQSILESFSSVLAQSKSGTYSELCDSTVHLREQSNTAAGVFDALFAGEYGAVATQVGPKDALRGFGTVVGITGISFGASGLILLGLAARGTPLPYLVSTAFSLILFGELILLAAYYPLSEIVCTSYLISLKMSGSYQRRGADGIGSIHTDFRLDGGLTRTTSVCFVPAAMASFEIDRILVNAVENDAESKAVMAAVQGHIARAAASPH